MPRNIGSLDRIIRAVIGVALIALAVVDHGPIRWLGLIGIVLLVTASVRFCPAYWLMRVKTLRAAR
jgi:hypothetical protein